MKKHFIYLASAALATGLAACSSDELEGSFSSANGDYEFIATLQQPEELPETRVEFDGTSSFSWELNDIIGVFNTNDNKAYKYGFADEAARKSGGFKKLQANRSDKETETYPDTKISAEYAFYPYALMVPTESDKKPSRTIISQGEFYIDLPGIDTSENASSDDSNELLEYTGASLKTPMAGKLSGNGISFTNLTAIWKLTVNHIPSEYTVAVFESVDPKAPIAGKAKVDVQAQTLTMLNSETLNAIAYDFSEKSKPAAVIEDEEGSKTESAEATTYSSKTFYFIVPAGDYPKGFNFYLKKATATVGKEGETDETTSDDITILNEYKIPVKQNYLYRGSYTISGDGTGLQSTEIKRVNKSLAAGAKAESIDLSQVTETSKAIIYLPKNNAESVTITLKNVGSNNFASGTISIVEDPAGDASKSVAKTVTLITDATEATNVPTLDIDLPTSTNVVLATPSDKETGFFSTVTANINASKNVNVNSGVTVSTLSITGGDIFAANGALLSSATISGTDNENPNYLYYEDSSNIPSNDGTNIVSAPKYIYDIKTQGTGTVNVTEDFTKLQKAITVEGASDLIINLQGHTLSSTAGVLDLTNSKVTIIDQDASGKSTEKGQLISTSSTATEYAITLTGSTLKLTDGTITSSQNGVKATGSTSKFEMTGGAIVSGNSKDAVSIYDEATTALTGGELKTGNVRVSAAGASTIGISVNNWIWAQNGSKKLTIKKNAESDKDITLTTVITDGSEVEINAETISGALEVKNSGKVTLNEGTVTGKVTLNNGTLIAAAGTKISGVADNAAIAATAKSTVSITGATIAPVDGQSALTLDDSEATIAGEANLSSTVATITAANGSTLKVNGGKVASTSAKVPTISTDGSSVAIAGGEISSTAVSTIKDAGDTASTIEISGGKVVSEEKTPLYITKGSSVTVTDGNIDGLTYAVYLTNGTLTVSGEGAPSFSGNKTIYAVGTVEVSLDAKGATYVSNNNTYTVYNTNDKGTAASAIKSISGGHFTGDIISDNSAYFITGGYFRRCANLEEKQSLYLDTFYKLGEKDTDDFWNVLKHNKDIE
jgi:hypothetical protein